MSKDEVLEVGASETKPKDDPPDFMGQSWTVHGEVVDADGNAIENFEAATIWSSNGVYWNESDEIPEDERANIWHSEGELAARPRYRAKRTSNGKFTLTIVDRPRAPVFAVDSDHRSGGIVMVERIAASQAVRIELKPLARVTAEILCPETGRAPDWTKAEIYVADGDNIFLTQCGTYQGKVSFLLPPGNYEINANSESPVARMRHPKRPSDIPLHGKYARGKQFTVLPDTAVLDLGVLDLFLPKDDENQPVDITQFYRKKPPSLAITDASGVSKDVSLEDLRGNWVLIEFWALWCSPCVAVELPKLIDFYQTRSSQRDQFEVLSICDTTQEEIQTIIELSPILQDLQERTWGGKPLPFPVLLDDGSRTADTYGISGRPSSFLIDPEGNLVNTLPDSPFDYLKKKLDAQ